MNIRYLVIAVFNVWLGASPAAALDDRILDSVVRLKPDWSVAARGRDATGAPRDPEGTGTVVAEGGYIATNLHVIGDAETVDVMMSDGRIMPAEIVGTHRLTDIVLLKIAVDLPTLPVTDVPPLAAPVCAIGNQFGLGLSVTCGVVSARHRSGTGFNPVEDFVQTDATVNPGGSGGALVTPDGQLVGMVSAIFTKDSDADIGVNFATSRRLLMRVVEDLRAFGEVRRIDPGLRVGAVPPPMSATLSGVLITQVDPAGPIFAAGLDAGDVLTHLDGRRIISPDHLNAELFLLKDDDTRTFVRVRGSSEESVRVQF